ncbi:MAG: diguanylate cyclase [Pseudomonadales bacterium]|nr:diguanylate cyclase [Pseudomonadales bacterium]
MSERAFQEKPKILLVDQDDSILCLFHTIFDAQYKVITANNGEHLLEDAVIEQPDLIILDTSIADMDALEKCFYLKSEPKTANIPVILISRGASKNLHEGFDVGVADYIFKPFNPDLLKARVSAHMNLHHATHLLDVHHRLSAVTLLPNEDFFNDELEKEWLHNVRCHQTVSLLLLDIDRFKHFKNIYGNALLETAQKNIAIILQTHCHRAKDFIAQLSDSRFAIFVTAEKHDHVALFAENLRSAVASTEFFHIGHQKPFRLSLSISLVTIKPDLTMKSNMHSFIQIGVNRLLEAQMKGDTVTDQLLSNLQLADLSVAYKIKPSPAARPM